MGNAGQIRPGVCEWSFAVGSQGSRDDCGQVSVGGKVEMRRKPLFPNIPPDAGITEEDLLLTTEDVARMLAVNPYTLKAWRCRQDRAGVGPPFIKVGTRFVRYSLRDVREYLSERTVQGQSKGQR
jgi:hypothetical protein